MKSSGGSALIMVLCICAVLMIATTSSWYTASLLHDASCVRQQAFQRKQSAHGLLVYATQKAKQRVEELYQDRQPTVLYSGPWPSGDRIPYTGCAVSCQENSRLKICVTLTKEMKLVARVAALLSRQGAHDDGEKNSLLVEQWGIDDIDVVG